MLVYDQRWNWKSDSMFTNQHQNFSLHNEALKISIYSNCIWHMLLYTILYIQLLCVVTLWIWNKQRFYASYRVEGHVT